MKTSLSINKLTYLLVVNLLFSTFYINAQQTKQIIPNGYDSAEGERVIAAPLIRNPRKYQILIAESELNSLVNKKITSITFRLPTSETTAWPANDVTFTNYEVYLGEAVNPADRSATFSENIIGELTQVRFGNLLIPAESFPVGGTPNEFGYEITFNTPWEYTGKNLLIEIINNGSDEPEENGLRFVEAVNSENPDFGTLFASLWGDLNSSSGIITASFGVIKITAEDSLGNNSFTLINNDLSAYPNPASDNLLIQSNTNINSISLYNTNGQIVLNKKTSNNRKHNLDISKLNTGTYILKVKTEKGVKVKTIIKK